MEFACGTTEWLTIFFAGLLTLLILSFFNLSPFWMILAAGVFVTLGVTVCLVLPLLH